MHSLYPLVLSQNPVISMISSHHLYKQCSSYILVLQPPTDIYHCIKLFFLKHEIKQCSLVYDSECFTTAVSIQMWSFTVRTCSSRPLTLCLWARSLVPRVRSMSLKLLLSLSASCWASSRCLARLSHRLCDCSISVSWVYSHNTHRVEQNIWHTEKTLHWYKAFLYVILAAVCRHTKWRGYIYLQ